MVDKIDPSICHFDVHLEKQDSTPLHMRFYPRIMATRSSLHSCEQIYKQYRNPSNEGWNFYEKFTPAGVCVLCTNDKVAMIAFKPTPGADIGFQAAVSDFFYKHANGKTVPEMRNLLLQAIETAERLPPSALQQYHLQVLNSNNQSQSPSFTEQVEQQKIKKHHHHKKDEKAEQIQEALLNVWKEELEIPNTQHPKEREMKPLTNLIDESEKYAQNRSQYIDQTKQKLAEISDWEKSLKNLRESIEKAGKSGEKVPIQVKGKTKKLSYENAQRKATKLQSKINREKPLAKQALLEGHIDHAQGLLLNSGLEGIKKGLNEQGNEIGAQFAKKAAKEFVHNILHPENNQGFQKAVLNVAKEVGVEAVQQISDQMHYKLVCGLLQKCSPKIANMVPRLPAGQAMWKVGAAALEAKSVSELIQKVGEAGLMSALELGVYGGLAVITGGESVVLIGVLQGAIMACVEEGIERSKAEKKEVKAEEKPKQQEEQTQETSELSKEDPPESKVEKEEAKAEEKPKQQEEEQKEEAAELPKEDPSPSAPEEKKKSDEDKDDDKGGGGGGAAGGVGGKSFGWGRSQRLGSFGLNNQRASRFFHAQNRFQFQKGKNGNLHQDEKLNRKTLMKDANGNTVVLNDRSTPPSFASQNPLQPVRDPRIPLAPRGSPLGFAGNQPKDGLEAFLDEVSTLFTDPLGSGKKPLPDDYFYVTKGPSPDEDLPFFKNASPSNSAVLDPKEVAFTVYFEDSDGNLIKTSQEKDVNKPKPEKSNSVDKKSQAKPPVQPTTNKIGSAYRAYQNRCEKFVQKGEALMAPIRNPIVIAHVDLAYQVGQTPGVGRALQKGVNELGRTYDNGATTILNCAGGAVAGVLWNHEAYEGRAGDAVKDIGLATLDGTVSQGKAAVGHAVAVGAVESIAPQLAEKIPGVNICMGLWQGLDIAMEAIDTKSPEVVVEKGVPLAVNTAGGVVGQILIPIPGLGAAVGTGVAMGVSWGTEKVAKYLERKAFQALGDSSESFAYLMGEHSWDRWMASQLGIEELKKSIGAEVKSTFEAQVEASVEAEVKKIKNASLKNAEQIKQSIDSQFDEKINAEIEKVMTQHQQQIQSQAEKAKTVFQKVIAEHPERSKHLKIGLDIVSQFVQVVALQVKESIDSEINKMIKTCLKRPKWIKELEAVTDEMISYFN